MQKLLGILGVLALVALPVNQAAATSISEDLTITYDNLSNNIFTLSDFSFASATSGNLLSGSIGGSFGYGSGTLFNQIVTVNTGQSYTFSFNGSFPGGSFLGGSSLVATGGPQSIGSFAQSTNGSFSFYAASVAVSPVPLPASFPLFALALVALGVFGYHTARTNGRTSSVPA
jgi:hypothetical protein